MRAMVHREFFSSLNEMVSVLKYEHYVNSTVAISFYLLRQRGAASDYKETRSRGIRL